MNDDEYPKDPFGQGPAGSGPFGLPGFDPAAMQMFMGQFTRPGGTDWEAVAQMAAAVAAGGRSEANVDPSDRMTLEDLVRVAELHVAAAAGRPVLPGGRPVALEVTTRGAYARRTVTDLRRFFEVLADSLGGVLKRQLGALSADDLEIALPPGIEFPPGFDPRAMITQMMGMLGPVLVSALSANTAGQLGARALGQYDLPLPRPTDAPLLVVIDNIDSFAREWNLPPEEVRMWVLVHELSLHHVLAGTPAGDTLRDLLVSWAGGFTDDFDGLERRLGELGLDDIDPTDPAAMSRLNGLLGQPEALLGAMASPAQQALQPRIDTAVAVVLGHADHLVDHVASRLIPSHRLIAEGLRRRRVEAGPAGRFVERLLGLQITPASVEAGRAFISGVVERAGDATLSRLWSDPTNIPTPNELEAPGLWLARLGIEGVEVDPIEAIDIPDSPEGL